LNDFFAATIKSAGTQRRWYQGNQKRGTAAKREKPMMKK
jgi:hypothetical protein